MKKITDTLDVFFKGKEQVLVIKGDWGCGKTFFWDKYIQNKIEAKEKTGKIDQIAYSYVSLFGKNSLVDIRASLLQAAKLITTEEKINVYVEKHVFEKSGFLGRILILKKRFQRIKYNDYVLKALNITNNIDKFTRSAAFLEDKLVDNYVICFDDIERKGNSLSMRDFMGYIDELARKRNCKLILIFNEKSFTNEIDIKDLEQYREKVVDIELAFKPTYKQNLSYIFPDTHPVFPLLEKALNVLNLKNIRIIKKIRSLIDLSWSELEKSDKLIIEEFVNHATVLCWAYYAESSGLSLEFVKEHLEEGDWTAYLTKKKGELTDKENYYSSISIALQLSSSLFDEQIIDYLRYGYIDIEEIRRTVTELSNEIQKSHAREALSDVWNLYANSFKDNQNEIVKSFREVLTNDYTKLKLYDYAAALEMLTELNDDPIDLMELYIKNDQELLHDIIQKESWTVENSKIRYEPLINYMAQIQSSRENAWDINTLSARIADNHAWNPEDIDYLSSVSVDEFVAWIKTNPDDLPRKLKEGLLSFGQIAGKDSSKAKYDRIATNVKSAIIKLASESYINNHRAQILYNIIPEQETELGRPSLRSGRRDFQ